MRSGQTQKPQIRMIAFDLDGTILTHAKTLSQRTEKALRQAAASGVILLPVTGRPLHGIPEEIRSLPGIRHVITSNGSSAYTAATGEALFRNTLSPRLAGDVLSFLSSFHPAVELFSDGWGYQDRDAFRFFFSRVKNTVLMPYFTASRKTVDSLTDVLSEARNGIENIHVVFRTEEDMNASARLMVDRFPGLCVIKSTALELEIISASCSKGRALLMYAGMNGIPAGDILAFGDGDSDRSMLRAAGIGVAMGNAPPLVRQDADLTALSNDEDGVAKLLEQFENLYYNKQAQVCDHE